MSAIDLSRMTLLEMLRPLSDGRVSLDSVFEELRRRPCLDADYRPGDPLPVRS